LDRETLRQLLQAVNLRLQELELEKSNFIARALHDLRTPLTALQGYCGLLAEGKLGPMNAVQKELLERMRWSSRRLAGLVEGAVSLLTQGHVERAPRCNASDMGETLERALHDVYPFVQDKGLQIEIDLQPAAGALGFEAEQIQRVFVNLLENSCKFTPKQGRVQIKGYSFQREDGNAPEGYRVDVNDSGPGVTAELSEKIFEQFTSYGECEDRSGGGLGLAICRSIIKAHGGAIWATPSQNGGRFSFFLPFREPVPVHKGMWDGAALQVEQVC